MPDGFEVDSEAAGRAAPKFSAAADELAAAVADLRSVLAGTAAMCGDDEQGRKFANGYEPAAKLVDESLVFAAKGVFAVSDALTAMGGNYTNAEDINVRASRRIALDG